MNKIRIIDLLNKIANGEELPFKIKYYGKEYDLKNDGCFDYYVTDDRWLLLDELESTSQLKDIVEILDEEDEFEDIEEMNFNYSCDCSDKIEINFNRHKDFINSLIKNQKKIIERLNKLNI